MTWSEIALMYMVIGIIALGSLYVINWFKTRNDPPKEPSVLDKFLRPESKTWGDKAMEVFAGVLVVAFVIAAWPGIIAYAIKEHFFPKPPYVERTFVLVRDDLKSIVTIAEIERREIVSDPLGAAPNIPFGHLNPAWEQFKEGIQEGDILWVFSSRWADDWGRTELRDGYAIAHADESIGEYFMTRWTFLESPKPDVEPKKSWLKRMVE